MHDCTLFVGTDQVVVGDLVYCKDLDTENVKGIANAEGDDEEAKEALDPHDLDEISGSDLPEEKRNPVMVCCSGLSFCLFKVFATVL